VCDDVPLDNKQPTTNPITVVVANNETIQSTHTGTLPIKGLPPEAATAHTFDNLQHNLIGVSPLTQAGCTVTFEKEQATIQCPNEDPIICPATNNGLWTVPLRAATAITNTVTAVAMQATKIFHEHIYEPFMALATIGNSNHPADLVAFHHAALFSPTMATLETAITKQYLPPRPGLTLTTLRKYKPDLEATAMGHMDAKWKNIQSTKKKQPKHRQTTTDDDGWTLIHGIQDAVPDEATSESSCRYPQQNPECSHHCYIATAEPKT
jgi:hypothetical protein